MTGNALKPGTRKLAWALLALTAFVLVGGISAWIIGFYRMADIQADIDRAAASKNAPPKPIVSDEELETAYKAGFQNFKNKDYAQAIDTFRRVVTYRADYKDSSALLLLSYKALAELQSSDPAKLASAPQTFGEAVTLAKVYPNQLTQAFKMSPNLLPENSGTFEGLAQSLEQQQTWAEHYARGNAATPTQDNWWEAAITEWEPVYQVNPNYLKENPTLWVSNRLADSYQSKAIFLCRVKADYGQALAAADRAVEIARNSKIPDTRQKTMLGLVNFINQTQCQAS